MEFTDIFWTIVASGGGASVITLAVVRTFGEKWLDSKFTSRLQDLRHEHERQMESVRLETSRMLDRSTRLSEREFEASADSWSLVFDVYARTMGALPGYRQHDDFTHLSDTLARIVADKNDFEDWEVDELMNRSKSERNSYFNERKRVHEMRGAKIAVREASNYLDRKALFLDKDVHDQLKAFVDWAWDAIVAREIIIEVGSKGMEGIRRDDNDFRKNAETEIKKLEQLVRGRFWGASEKILVES